MYCISGYVVATILVIFAPLKKFVMHKHITYYIYAHNKLSASVDSTSVSPQVNFLLVVHEGMYDLPGGGGTFGGWASCIA